MVLWVTMDFFQHRYYRLCKFLMVIIGQWPYQSTRVRVGIIAVVLSIRASAITPQILGLKKYRHDPTMLLEIVILNVMNTISDIKLFSYVVHSRKRLKLLKCIRTDWQLWARDREVNILHGYAERGEKITILFTGIAYLSLFVIMAEPLMPTIVDTLLRNGTASLEFPYPVVYYNIDEQKYYIYLIIYSNIGVYLLITFILSDDILLIVYVQHACGLFAAVGHKLKRIGNDQSVKTGQNPQAPSNKYMEQLASCINRHNDAIEYANLVEASYTQTFFITTGVGMILINIVGLQAVMTTGDLATTVRYIFFVLVIMFYFYLECYVSQMLIDHSLSIRFYIYNSPWYKLPPTAQKSLQFMMMRCTIPCQLTAGKMLVLSVKTFMLSLKTTISYFGFLRSTQGL